MILSILIPSLVERSNKLNYIQNRINNLILKDNLSNKVEVLTEIDNRELTTGKKRNILKERANGLYVCYIDDDDDISDDYLTEILNAIEISNADVITFCLNKNTNGVFEYQNIFSKFMAQGYLVGSDNKILVMLPVHLCPHKKGLADKIRFPHTCFREDYEYMLLLDKITKTEYHIDKSLYFYNYISGKY